MARYEQCDGIDRNRIADGSYRRRLADLARETRVADAFAALQREQRVSGK